MSLWKKKQIPKFKLIHLQHNVKKRVKLKRTPRWERTYDIQGHKPKFQIRCFHCEMPMSLRHSVIIDPAMATANEEDTDLNVMSYKCPRCAWFIRFNVLDSNRYLKKVIKKYRKGYRKFIPSIDDWSEEEELIKKQLAQLGYWGGREDCEKELAVKEKH